MGDRDIQGEGLMKVTSFINFSLLTYVPIHFDANIRC